MKKPNGNWSYLILTSIALRVERVIDQMHIVYVNYQYQPMDMSSTSALVDCPFLVCLCSIAMTKVYKLERKRTNKMLPIFLVFKHFKRIESTILGASQAYMTQTHIQFLINWIMRNENNPVMKQFHVVPMEVIAHLTFLFEDKNTSSDMIVIDRYCCDNWQKL
jgi:hypothetical protein